LWFGVTGFTVRVSDTGNRGWVVEQYEDMYHGDTHPQVLSLRSGSLNFVPEDVQRYHRLYSGDFTWEAYCKRLSPEHPPRPSTPHPHSTRSSEAPLPEGMSSNTVFQNAPEGNSSDANSSGALVALTINEDGFPVLAFNSNEHHRVGGQGRTKLKVGAWYHLAVVVRRSSHVAQGRADEGISYDAILGEVALYVDGELDTAWSLDSGRAHYGGSPQKGVLVMAGGGSNKKQSGMSFSRARVWARALLPGELGQCKDLASPTGGGPEGRGEQKKKMRREGPKPGDVSSILTSPKQPGDDDAGALAFSFSLGGSLAETNQRAAARPTGAWSFDVDVPPKCSGLTESPYDNVFEHCACYDRSLSSYLKTKNVHTGLGKYLPYVWHSPQAYSGVKLDMKAYVNNRVLGFNDRGLNASMFFAVYRSFVNEAPVLSILEPAGGNVETLEDNPTYVSLQVTHKATDQLVGRPFVLTMAVSHGFVRTISASTVVKIAQDRRQIEYRAPFTELNDFLAQIEYVPDPNYNGLDSLFITVSDLEFTVNVTMPIHIAVLNDPLTLVCPPAVDLMEGDTKVLIGGNISIYDSDQIPGKSDSAVEVAVEMFVGDGGLMLNVNESLLRRQTRETELYDGTGAVNTDFISSAGWSTLVQESNDLAPTIRFNTTLAELRAFLNAVSFTPSPPLFHGVVHFGLFVSILGTGEEASCDVGLVVHPVNTPPIIYVDKARLLAIPTDSKYTDGTLAFNADEDILLRGVLKLADPDEEDFYDWFTKRTHSARLVLRVNCGSLSWDLYTDADYVYGEVNGSIAGAEGLTFHNGDGYKDPLLNVTSTLDHLNGQLHRLYYHSYGCAGQNITLFVELDDLGNYGAPACTHCPTALSVRREIFWEVLPDIPGSKKLPKDVFPDAYGRFSDAPML